jgi:hypothetical protein
MSDKIHPRHLARKAILYVRQSSSYQVANNEESRRLQYAMRERLEQLGWEQIEVIDRRPPYSFRESRDAAKGGRRAAPLPPCRSPRLD